MSYSVTSVFSMIETLASYMEENLRFKLLVLEIEIVQTSVLLNEISASTAKTIEEVVLQIDEMRRTIQPENELRKLIGYLREELEEEAQELMIQADENPEQQVELTARELGLEHSLEILYKYRITGLDYYYLGCQFFKNSKYQNALEAFQQSLSIDEHAKTYEWLAVTLDQIGKQAEALIAIEKAYQHNPKNSKTATLFAKILIHHQQQ
jgi:tetratricopeptide (TPR) repeat protein